MTKKQQYRRAHYLRHREEILRRKREYYQAHREKQRAISRRFYRRHRSEERERDRQRRLSESGRILIASIEAMKPILAPETSS